MSPFIVLAVVLSIVILGPALVLWLSAMAALGALYWVLNEFFEAMLAIEAHEHGES